MFVPECLACGRLSARVRRVQQRELGERADPAPERAAEAVRMEEAAQPPHARAGGGMRAMPSPPRRGRGAAHSSTRSVSLPSSHGMEPVREFPHTRLRARRHRRSSDAATVRGAGCMRRCARAYEIPLTHARTHANTATQQGCVHMYAAHAHTRTHTAALTHLVCVRARVMFVPECLARGRLSVRVRRVQQRELDERADPAPERAAEAVRLKLAAQPPHARAGAGCVRGHRRLAGGAAGRTD